jgi:hypothetical protein
LAFICPALATRLGVAPRIGIHSPRCWQHARGLRLALAFIRPALATRSGAVPRIGISSPQRWQHALGLRLEFAFLRPSVGNTLGGCASNLHSFAPALPTRSGAAPYNPMLATLGGYAYMLTLASTIFVPGVSNTLGTPPYAVNLNSLQQYQLYTVDHIDSDLRCSTPVIHTPATPTPSPTMTKCSGARQRQRP